MMMSRSGGKERICSQMKGDEDTCAVLSMPHRFILGVETVLSPRAWV
jgi:hypothetical protein